jgi:septum formation protein
MITTTRPPLILASNSPRRSKLLEDAGYKFEVRPTNVSEEFSPAMTPNEVPIYLATLKAQSLWQLSHTHLIIAADTIVALGDSIINKPKDEAEARWMLRLLSGNMHTVITGVCLMYNGKKFTFNEHTNVFFRILSDVEIDYYIAKFHPMDKAGAYGIQDYIGLIGVYRIEGDFYNVMGLPVCRLHEEINTLFSPGGGFYAV